MLRYDLYQDSWSYMNLTSTERSFDNCIITPQAHYGFYFKTVSYLQCYCTVLSSEFNNAVHHNNSKSKITADPWKGERSVHAGQMWLLNRRPERPLSPGVVRAKTEETHNWLIWGFYAPAWSCRVSGWDDCLVFQRWFTAGIRNDDIIMPLEAIYI